MIYIIAYLLGLLVLGTAAAVWLQLSGLAASHATEFIICSCILAGLCGGLVNCLRAVYLNACVRKKWDTEWHPWYVIRPILSAVMGGISYVFIRAGLIVFGGDNPTREWSVYGYLAVSFIAGYNVQRFLERLEAISEASFGVKKKETPQTESEGEK